MSEQRRPRLSVRALMAAGLPLLALASFLTACESPPEGHSSEALPLALDEKILSAALEVTIIDREPNTQAALSSFAWQVRVERVLYRRDVLHDERGRVVDTFQDWSVGDTAIMGNTLDVFERGERYLVLINEWRSVHGEAILPWAAYRASDLMPVIDPEPPLFALVADPEKATVEEVKQALAAYLDEARWYRDALRMGVDDPVIGEHLARALALRPPTTPEVSADYDPELGMTITAYLALDPPDRQLLEFDLMPPEVIEALDLIPVFVVVIYDTRTLEAADALGIATDTGVMGPYHLGSRDRATGFTFVWGSAARDEELRLVIWPRVGGDVSRDLSPRDAIAWQHMPAISRFVADPARGDRVLVIDLIEESVNEIRWDEVEPLLVDRGLTSSPDD